MRNFPLLLCVAYICVSCGIEAGGDVETSDGVNLNEHRIFVSSTTTDGNMGGLSGADTICSNAASGANLTRTYKALVSGSGTNENAKERLSFSGPIYTVSSGVKNLVAASGTALWNSSSSNLSNRVNRDENGNTVSAGVWTGTNSDGSLTPSNNCSDWSSSTANAFFGSTDQFDDRWVESNTASCSTNTLRVYCVSQ